MTAGAVRTVDGEQVDDPELAALYEKRQDLETRIAELRAVRDAMEETVYEARLEDLIVELALTTREIRAKEGGGGR